MIQVTNTKYIARAPRRREVEELNCKEIFEALERKSPVETLSKPGKEKQKVEVPKEFTQAMEDLEGTLEAALLNDKMIQMEQLPVSQLAKKLEQTEGVDAVIFDGIITQRIVDVASKKNIKYVIASRISNAVKPSLNVKLMTFSEVKRTS